MRITISIDVNLFSDLNGDEVLKVELIRDKIEYMDHLINKVCPDHFVFGGENKVILNKTKDLEAFYDGHALFFKMKTKGDLKTSISLAFPCMDSCSKYSPV